MISRRHGDSLSLDCKRLGPLLSVLLALGLCATAQAHPESLSNLRLVITPRELRATLTLPMRDLTGWFPPGRYHNYIADVVGELQKSGGSLLEVHWDDSADLTPLIVNVHPGKIGFIIADMRYAAPASGNTLVVRSAQIGNLPDAHQQVAWLEDERSGVANSRVVAEQVLTAQDDTLSVEMPDPPATTQPAVAQGASTTGETSPSTKIAESPLAPSRIPRHATLFVLPVIFAGALFIAFIVLKRRPQFVRRASQASTWVTSVCGRSN